MIPKSPDEPSVTARSFSITDVAAESSAFEASAAWIVTAACASLGSGKRKPCWALGATASSHDAIEEIPAAGTVSLGDSTSRSSRCPLGFAMLDVHAFHPSDRSSIGCTP